MPNFQELGHAEYNIEELNKLSNGKYFIKKEMAGKMARYTIMRAVDYNHLGRPVADYFDAKEIGLVAHTLQRYAFEDAMAKEENEDASGNRKMGAGEFEVKADGEQVKLIIEGNVVIARTNKNIYERLFDYVKKQIESA